MPDARQLSRCRLVAHRGGHDGEGRLENTLAAFDAAADAGVWGLEMDVRWTLDRIPVIFHDADTRRLFGPAARIDAMTTDEVGRRFPAIPTLAEVVARYGGRQHLMIEIKTGAGGSSPQPFPCLTDILAPLTPGRDYHLMSLEPALFDSLCDLPRYAFLPIARLRMDRFSRLAAIHGWGGVTGHYLTATRGVLRRHHRLGQRVGTGFADAKACLFREAARGVDWVFTNRAVEMQRICDGGRS